MTREQARIGARQTVFGQQRDHFEQRRPQIVIEVLRRQGLPSGSQESSQNIRGELPDLWALNGGGEHGLVFYQPEAGVGVRVFGAIPVTERTAGQSSGRSRRGSLDHIVLAIEKIR